VLDHVERRRFLVEPAGEDASPLPVRSLDVDLHESAGQLFLFPRRRCLAGAQAHDHVLPARRLAGVKRDILHNPVPLVEDAKHRDALRHWRDSSLVASRPGRIFRRRGRILRHVAAVTSGEREREQQNGRPLHDYSGIQGS
jgi:hypothetical protein